MKSKGSPGDHNPCFAAMSHIEVEPRKFTVSSRSTSRIENIFATTATESSGTLAATQIAEDPVGSAKI